MVVNKRYEWAYIILYVNWFSMMSEKIKNDVINQPFCQGDFIYKVSKSQLVSYLRNHKVALE